MTEAERIVAEKKAEAQAKAAEAAQTATKTRQKTESQQPDKNIESSLALVADTQYQNGFALVRRVGQNSFMQGIQDGLEQLIDGLEMDGDQLDAIAAKFQAKASNSLKGERQPLILPASAWLQDDE